jgi:spermidine/putrescine ABC transporter ATP-binding subunit
MTAPMAQRNDSAAAGRATEKAGAPRGVRIEHVSRRFGSVLAVDDAHISIAAGRFLTLLGPSGSGKTTLLQMIAGLLPPESGRIHIGEADVTDLAPHRRDIGMVFQSYALFPHLTIRENIAFPLRLRRLADSEIDRHVASALEMIGLPHVGERRIAELSGGQQQRIALARALVYRPSVLLMDEPLGALDRKLRDQMKFEIKSIQQRLGITVVYVTHDQDEALTMSDMIAVMNDGRVVQMDDPHAVYRRPATRFVAEFVGDSNLFTGRLSALDGREARVETGLGAMAGHFTGASGAVGDAVCVMVRPERARVLRTGERADQEIQATVDQALFRGEFTEIGARARDGNELRVKGAAELGPEVRPGAAIRVGWALADAVVVPDEQARRG